MILCGQKQMINEKTEPQRLRDLLNVTLLASRRAELKRALFNASGVTDSSPI